MRKPSTRTSGHIALKKMDELSTSGIEPHQAAPCVCPVRLANHAVALLGFTAFGLLLAGLGLAKFPAFGCPGDHAFSRISFPF